MPQQKFVTKRTAQLKPGPELDWFVSQCLKGDVLKFYLDAEGGSTYVVFKNIFGEFRFQPSTNWAQAGPLMEEFMVDVRWVDVRWACSESCWAARSGHAWAQGDTMLSAAMRAIAVEKFGEFVEVPQEIAC